MEPRANVPELTVGELSFALRRTIEDGFGYVRVRGEISGFKRHGSGHLYFALKDEQACIDAVCWRITAGRLRFKPEDGLEVVATGKVTTYPQRSRYQIVIDQLTPAGAGALMALLDDRKRKLAAEGLFASERKRPLPFLPDVVGVVTSPTGAVIRDILHRLAERFPRRVLVWPVAVQGDLAASQVAMAIDGMNGLRPGGPVPRPDVLIVARGGGSLEDLWAFNEEVVVRAAAGSAIPLIAAVGHETDTTLIDLAADRRAPTPTAAAEMAVPVRSELLARLIQLDGRLQHAVDRDLKNRRQLVLGLVRGLPDPLALLGQAAQRVDDLSDDLPRTLRALTDHRRSRVTELGARLRSPDQLLVGARHRLHLSGERLGERMWARLRERSEHLRHLGTRLSVREVQKRLPEGAARVGDLGGRARHAIERRLESAREKLDALGSRLGSVGYEQVLARGFALVRDDSDRLVPSAERARSAGLVQLQFQDGRVWAAVDEAPRRRSLRRTPEQARLL